MFKVVALTFPVFFFTAGFGTVFLTEGFARVYFNTAEPWLLLPSTAIMPKLKLYFPLLILDTYQMVP